MGIIKNCFSIRSMLTPVLDSCMQTYNTNIKNLSKSVRTSTINGLENDEEKDEPENQETTL